MTKNWKRWLAAGLCAAMVGGMLPTSSAMAEEVEAQPLLPVEEQQETPEGSLLPEGEKKDHDEPIENNEPTAETLSEEEELLAEEKEPLEEEEEDLLPEEAGRGVTASRSCVCRPGRYPRQYGKSESGKGEGWGCDFL